MLGFGPIASAPIGAGDAFTAIYENQDFDVLISSQLLLPEGKSDEGALISTVTNVWSRILTELISNPNLFYEFSKNSRIFEEFVAGIYVHHGWDKVTLTPRSGDGGRDVIAEKSGFTSMRILDQCKAFKKGHLVGIEDARSMAGVLSLDLNATKVIISTTSYFEMGIFKDKALKQMIPYRLELRNRDDLINWALRKNSHE